MPSDPTVHEPTPSAAPPGAPPESRLKSDLELSIEQLAEEAKALHGLLTLLRPLSRAVGAGDLQKLSTQVQAVTSKLAALGPLAERGRTILETLSKDVEQERQTQRERLSKDLRALCEARGLSMRVVSREEPVEVRIPPFAVVIDRQRGQAELRFARLKLLGSAARAEDILAAHARCLEELNRGVPPREFFDACLRAWRAARAGAGPESSERIEFGQFLPYLALQMQSKAFGIDPTAENYRTYSRVRFAFDILRLQKAGSMSAGGWRLNLGVATGTTASAKNRAIFIENEDGEGEFKLTVFFTPAATP